MRFDFFSSTDLVRFFPLLVKCNKGEHEIDLQQHDNNNNNIKRREYQIYK